MEFLNQNKQNQRYTERFVIILYVVYTINLCIGIIQRDGPIWILIIMLLALAVGSILFLSKYRNYKVRACLSSILLQLTIILYATNTKDLFAVIPTFIFLVLLVAIYGFSRLLWITIASLLFIMFYHGVITDTFQKLPKTECIQLLLQLGNILCIELALYIWLKNRKSANKQTYKMMEALMKAEQSKDDFLSNVSHEIRTPVNTICGMSEIALREQDFEKMRDEVFDIRDAGNNLMLLVNDILDFAQLQQDKMDLEEEAYTITSTINDVINMAMARKGIKPIELIVDCAADIPNELLGDEKKIRRVIMNLLDNAIKFTNEGGVILVISVRRESYGVNLCIEIKDTGIGMEEESLEKLFESFNQVDVRKNRQNGGIGLGLAISRKLIEKMGGTITVRSRLGRGTVFRFVVPQKILDEKPIGQVEKKEEINAVTYFDMEQFDMMAIRDEYSNLILHMIQQLKVKCHICRNLAELKRREGRENFTHVFISLEEYQEDSIYFDELTKRSKVIMVIDRYNEKYITNADIIRLYKPLYILPIASILNEISLYEVEDKRKSPDVKSNDKMEHTRNKSGWQMIRQGKFITENVHILVVDDNIRNIRVIEGLLKEYQIKVTYATSGKEALEVIENMSYDFVFMDHMMPEMDGIETMHRIRNKVGHYYQQVPILALTANAAPGNREMFLAEGFQDFLAKPVEISVLERVLKRNLPENKLIYQIEKEKNMQIEKDRNEVENKKPFTIGELDVEKGLLYCGKEEAYLEVVAACCQECTEQCQLLERLYQNQDWKNYTIKVHALKSTMQNIGATTVARRAKDLEQAGKKEDIDYVRENHKELLDEYQRVMAVAKQSEKLHNRIQNEEIPSNQNRNNKDLLEISEEVFDEMLEEIEQAAYSLGGERMFAILSQLESYCYHQIALQAKLAPVQRKVQASDYISAVDMLMQIRNDIRNKQEGGI